MRLGLGGGAGWAKGPTWLGDVGPREANWAKGRLGRPSSLSL